MIFSIKLRGIERKIGAAGRKFLTFPLPVWDGCNKNYRFWNLF